MAGDFIFAEHVFFVGGLEGAVMMDKIRDATAVALIGDDTDVVVKDDNIAALPFVGIVRISAEAISMATEPDCEIFDPAEVDVPVWDVDVISLRMGTDVGIDELHEVVAGTFERESNHVGADTMIVVRIASGVVDALILRVSGEVGASALQDVGLVVDAVVILVGLTSVIGDVEIGIGIPAMRNNMEAVEQSHDEKDQCSDGDSERELIDTLLEALHRIFGEDVFPFVIIGVGDAVVVGEVIGLGGHMLCCATFLPLLLSCS